MTIPWSCPPARPRPSLEEEDIRAIILEFIAENPLACAGILRLCEIVFTGHIDTMEVTFDNKPTLFINPDFVARECPEENDVKALLLHELLHVILGHTMAEACLSEVGNLAADAVINPMVVRLLQLPEHNLFQRYYAASTGFMRLLRCPSHSELQEPGDPPDFLLFWRKLWEGRATFDDVYQYLAGCRALARQPAS